MKFYAEVKFTVYRELRIEADTAEQARAALLDPLTHHFDEDDEWDTERRRDREIICLERDYSDEDQADLDELNADDGDDDNA